MEEPMTTLKALAVAAIIAAAAPFSAPSAEARGNGCELRGQVASQGNQRSQLAIRNEGAIPLYVFWIDYKGNERNYQNQDQPLVRIDPGQIQEITAAQGHYYSVYDENEVCLSVVRVDAPAMMVGYASGSNATPNTNTAQAQPQRQPQQQAAATTPRQPNGSATSADGDVMRILELVNQHRANGAVCTGTGTRFGPAPPLQLHQPLSQAATAWSQQMLNTGNFTHGDMQGRITAVCGQVAMGENIAANPTADGAVAGWMSSTSGHCEAIMNPTYRLIGIGKATGSQYGAYWTQKFADRCGR